MRRMTDNILDIDIILELVRRRMTDNISEYNEFLEIVKKTRGRQHLGI